MAETPTWKNNYEEFQKQAIPNSLVDCTRDEWEKFVKGKAFSLMSAISRVRNERKNLKATAERNILIIQTLGDRDGTSKATSLDAVKMTKVAAYMPGTEEFRELTSWGTFAGKHGKKCEVEVEHQVRTVKGVDYTSDVIRRVTMTDESVNINTLLSHSVGPYDITEDDKKPGKVMGVVGIIQERGWDYAPIFEEGVQGPTAFHPLIVNDKPAVQFIIHTNPSFRVTIGPSRLSNQLIELAGFNELAHMENGLDELCKTFSNIPCLFIGSVTSVKHKGENTYIEFRATAAFEITDEQYQRVLKQSANKTGGATKAAPELSSSVVSALIEKGDTGAGIEVSAMEVVVKAKFGDAAIVTLHKHLKVMVAKGNAKIDAGKVFKANKTLDIANVAPATPPAPAVVPSKAEEVKNEVLVAKVKIEEKKAKAAIQDDCGECPENATCPSGGKADEKKSVALDLTKASTLTEDKSYAELQRMVYRAYKALGDDLNELNFLSFAKKAGMDTSKLYADHVKPLISQVKAGQLVVLDEPEAPKAAPTTPPPAAPEAPKKAAPKKAERVLDLGQKLEDNKAKIMKTLEKLEKKPGEQVKFSDISKVLIADGLSHKEIEQAFNSIIDASDAYEPMLGWIARTV